MISVVIPTLNEGNIIERCLKSLSKQTYKDFEVIIVDSGSKDRTIEIASYYPVSIYQTEEASFNHGLTRNYGISKAQGEYVILLTADAIPCNNSWMEKLIENLKCDDQVAGVYSRQIPHKDAQLLTQMRVNRYFTASRERRESKNFNCDDYAKLSPRHKHRFCNFDNVSSCIRKSVWKKTPFSKTDFAEDLEWSKHVLEAGYKIVYEPESIVYHSHDFSILGLYKKTLINCSKLYSLFGLIDVDNIYNLFRNFIIYTLRDVYCLCREEKSAKIILANIYLIPLYSFSIVLGQYRGARIRDYSTSP